MKKIMIVFGTRPEAIKMCPLISELRSRKNLDVSVCVTGQHREMLRSVLDVFGVTPDFDLDIMQHGQTLYDITQKVMAGMKSTFEKVRPDIVLVHGDTTTTFSAALAAFYSGIPVGHVEAGLRTYDVSSPYPEEFNRQAVDSIAQLHFAPTALSRSHLLNEGKSPESVFVTGNTAIDALKTTVRSDYTHPALENLSGRLILLTAHRRENLGLPMHHIFRAIRRVTEETPDITVLYPIHMNPAVRAVAESELSGCDRIRLIEPLDVLDFHNFMARAFLILTDSGGIQEEAPSLGKPVLVLRNTTERPEGVAAGTLHLTGTEEDTVYYAFSRLLHDKTTYETMSRASNPYGDGFASRRIADVLEFGEMRA